MSPSARVEAFDAIVQLAIAEAEDGDAGSHWYRDGFARKDVEQEAPEVSTRTIDRALQDAEALGWIESNRQRWVEGPRAEAIFGEEEPDETPPI